MVKFHQPTSGRAGLTPGLRKSDKLKLIAMSAGALVVLIAILVSLGQGKRARSQPEGKLPPAEEPPTTAVFRPEVDKALLASIVRDGAGPDRVMLEPDAVEELMRAARQMPSSSYDDPTIGARELDAASIEKLLATPAPERGEPFFARGWIDSIEERSGPAGSTRYLGRLKLEDDSAIYFLAAGKPESTITGDFVRVNGLFLKDFSDEDQDHRGTWIDGPLLVGRELVRSYPSFGTVTKLDPSRVADVTDDDLEGGISGVPFESLWYAIAYARDYDRSSIDWNAAPVMSRESIQDVLANPDAHRFQPVRIPISLLYQVTVKRAGENPARIDEYTEGWICNMQWRQVFKFYTPEPHPELPLKDEVTARGFFFKNFAYEPREGGMQVSPLFVLTDLEHHERGSSIALVYLGWIIGISSVALLAFLSFLLTRDRRSSNALQERLTARRRARRSVTV